MRRDNVNSARNGRRQWNPHPRVIDAVTGAPRHLQVILLASGLVESGGRPDAVGDGGRSGGFLQEHDAGRGAGIAMRDRFNPYKQVQRAVKEFQAFYDKGARGPDLAYRAQRPADQADYVRKVAAAIPEARRILNGAGAPQRGAGTADAATGAPGQTTYRKAGRTIVSPGELTPQAQQDLARFLEASKQDVMAGRYDHGRIRGLVDKLEFTTPTEQLWEEVPGTDSHYPGDGHDHGDPVDLSPGGGYAGTEGIAKQLMRSAIQGTNVKVTSEKRDTRSTKSGNMSDHYVGNKQAYAFDLSDGSQPTPGMDRAASRIVAALGGPRDWGKRGGNFVKTVNGYRYQVIYRSQVGGNHDNHVHLGVRKV